jgi:hypothetical protein
MEVASRRHAIRNPFKGAQARTVSTDPARNGPGRQGTPPGDLHSSMRRRISVRGFAAEGGWHATDSSGSVSPCACGHTVGPDGAGPGHCGAKGGKRRPRRKGRAAPSRGPRQPQAADIGRVERPLGPTQPVPRYRPALPMSVNSPARVTCRGEHGIDVQCEPNRITGFCESLYAIICHYWSLYYVARLEEQWCTMTQFPVSLYNVHLMTLCVVINLKI